MGVLLHLDRSHVSAAGCRRPARRNGVTRLQPRLFYRFDGEAGAETTLRAFAAMAARGAAEEAAATYFVGRVDGRLGCFLYLAASRVREAALLQLETLAAQAGARPPDTTLAGVLRVMRSPAVLLGGTPSDVLARLRNPSGTSRMQGSGRR